MARWARRTCATGVVVAGLLTGNALVASSPGFALGGNPLPTRSAQPVPGPPTRLEARIRNQKVILTWRAPQVNQNGGVPTDYVVIWQAPPIMPLTAEVDTHSTATRYVSHLGPGTYEVEAKNAQGTGPPSKPVTV